jgi:hypothetical protein
MRQIGRWAEGKYRTQLTKDGTGVNVWSSGKCGKVKHGNHATFKKVAFTYVVIEHFSSTLSSISQAFIEQYSSISEALLNL